MSRLTHSAAFAASLSLALALPLTAAGPAGSAPQVSSKPRARTPELSVSTRLADRRSLVTGDRFYEMGTEDGTYPATGFHTRGEMGGFWTPPIKLLDGIWFKVGDKWLSASRYTSGWEYSRMDLGTHDSVRITRTDFAPDGIRAGLIGLRLRSSEATTVDLAVDAHSELMKVYPWGETKPSQTRYNLRDTGAVRGRNLLFRENGTPPVRHAETHHYAALVGSTLTPNRSALGRNFRGPQHRVMCPVSGGDNPKPQPPRCDDTDYGRGTGGRLQYTVKVPVGGRTVWFAVAGSDHGVAAARAAQRRALARPTGLLRAKVEHRRRVAARTRVRLPGDRLLQRSVRWSKQNIADSVQEARRLAVRVTHAGTVYPAPSGHVAKIRWIGAGWPDYPWLFATDGEYTSFAAVASGEFTAIKNHLRALRSVSLAANGRSGKVVHEVTSDGQVYFGANGDEGNTDETAKFPSTVALVWRWTGDNRFRDRMYDFAVSNMRYIYRRLDADHDGWPEGLGNVERPGMGQEKLDNAVYTDRGLRDLADLAASKGDRTTQRWASRRARSLERRFEDTWWFGPSAQQYADSLSDPGNKKVFQRHWIGLTPVDAELVRPGRPDGPLASVPHARRAVAKREEPCYSGTYGLFHTGTGATTDPKGNPGPACDSTVSTVPAERSVFTLNTSLMAVSEAALGRMGVGQVQRYTTDNATVQLDPTVWELPGAMPEIAPSPDFGANIDKLFTERSMALQAWGTYGVLWPVVHYELGIAPDMGRSRLRVVPQVPAGQHRVSARNVRLAGGAVAVSATRSGGRLETRVRHSRRVALSIGAVLPHGAAVRSVRLDGHRASYQVVETARGREVTVRAGSARGVSDLVVRIAS